MNEAMKTKFSENRINKEQLIIEFGINIDSLRESGDLEIILNGGRSQLVTMYPIIGGCCFPLEAKLTLREKADGDIIVVPHPIRQKPNLDEYHGHVFTDKEREELLLTGKLSHPVMICSQIFELKGEVWVKLDRETNEIYIDNQKA